MRLNRCLIMCFAACMLLLSLQVQVYANTIDELTITIEIDQGGTAKVTEKWEGNFPDGSEHSIRLDNLMGATVIDYKVMSPTFPDRFQEVSPWDSKKSREDKAFTYGLLENSKGHRLCWGVGGLEEKGVFFAEYTVADFLKRYEDGATGFHWQLVASGMDLTPEKVSFSVRRTGAFYPDETQIMAYGSEGHLQIRDGIIYGSLNGKMDMINI